MNADGLKTFTEFVQVSPELELAFLLEADEDNLCESAKTLLHKSGLHISRSKGLLGHLKDAGVGLTKLVIAAAKGDKDKVKEIIKNVKKEDIIDFLLKVDQATLHTLTGPIHFIDAVTGIHIGADVEKHRTSFSDKMKKSIVLAKNAIIDLKNQNLRKKINNNLDRISKLAAI